MRGRAARFTASHARSMSPRLARARPQMIGGSLDGRPSTTRVPTFSAIVRTAARSSGEAAGKPASMTSTPRRASARATSSFSGDVIVAPGDCSPSRSVVSKIRTYPSAISNTVHLISGAAGGLGPRQPAQSVVRSYRDGIQERHHRAELRADLLDRQVALLGALRRERLAPGLV